MMAACEFIHYMGYWIYQHWKYMDTCSWESYWWLVNIGSGNASVLSINKPLPNLMLTYFLDTIKHEQNGWQFKDYIFKGTKSKVNFYIMIQNDWNLLHSILLTITKRCQIKVAVFILMHSRWVISFVDCRRVYNAVLAKIIEVSEKENPVKLRVWSVLSLTILFHHPHSTVLCQPEWALIYVP